MADDRTIYRFEGDATGLITASREAIKVLQKTTTAAKKTSGELEDIGDKSKKTGGALDNLSSKGNKTTKAVSTLGAAIGTAAAVVSGLVVAITAAVTVVVGIAAAFVGATIELHKFILAAEKTYKELEPLYELGALKIITPQQVSALKNYAGNWEALKVVIKDLAVAIGANLAGDLDRVSFEILVISIHVTNLAKSWLSVNSILRTSIKENLLHPIRAIHTALRGLLLLLQPIIKTLESVGILSQGTFKEWNKSLDKSYSKFDKLADRMIDNGLADFQSALATATGGMDGARAQATLLRAAMDHLAEATEKAKKALKGEKGEEEEEGWWSIDLAESGMAAKGGVLTEEDQIDLSESGMAAEGGIVTEKKKETEEEKSPLEKSIMFLDEIASKMSDLEDPTGIWRDTLLEVAGIFETLQDTDFSSLENSMQTVADIASSIGNFIGRIIQQQIRGGEELTKAQKKNLKTLFAMQKAAAMVSVVINTALGISQALASLPPPISYITAAFTAAMGAVQLAQIAAQKPPFHTGGIIPESEGVTINALPGEAVLNREATANLGTEGVDALNSGSNTGKQPMVIQMVYKKRIFDNFISDNLAAGGPLADAINDGRQIGHRKG